VWLAGDIANFNPRSPCGERPARGLAHSLCRDNFNPRSPCGERRQPGHPPEGRVKFQSTLPVWGATVICYNSQKHRCHFNPRSPCGERHPGNVDMIAQKQISIHAPRVGSDPPARGLIYSKEEFQSTLPVWGATPYGHVPAAEVVVISIHAPRVGSDPGFKVLLRKVADFNPRSPCGERLFDALHIRPAA